MYAQTEIRGTTIEVKLSDRLTFTDHVAFRAILETIRKAGSKEVIFDLAGLQTVDSAGLGMFIVAHEAGTKEGWTVQLVNAGGYVKKLLTLGRFDKFMNVA